MPRRRRTLTFSQPSLQQWRYTRTICINDSYQCMVFQHISDQTRYMDWYLRIVYPLTEGSLDIYWINNGQTSYRSYRTDEIVYYSLPPVPIVSFTRYTDDILSVL